MEDYSEYSAPELVRMLGSRFKDYRHKVRYHEVTDYSTMMDVINSLA